MAPYVFLAAIILCILANAGAFMPTIREHKHVPTKGRSLSMIGGLLNRPNSKAGRVSTTKIEFSYGPNRTVYEARPGDPLSEAAEDAGVEIKYKCKKGECGTCEVKMDGKWVRTCQTSVPTIGKGETLDINVPHRQTKDSVKQSASFFSPQSFVDGFTNNAKGVFGFVKSCMDADDEFNERMERERALAERVAAAKRVKEGQE